MPSAKLSGSDGWLTSSFSMIVRRFGVIDAISKSNRKGG